MIRLSGTRWVDTSAILRVLFAEPGPTVSFSADDGAVASELLEIEAFRAVDRERLLGNLDDREVAHKRKELTDIIGMLDLAPVDRRVIDRAKASFSVNIRTLDAIQVATAEVLAGEAGETVELWTHDDRQGLAALSRGLTVRGIPSDDSR